MYPQESHKSSRTGTSQIDSILMGFFQATTKHIPKIHAPTTQISLYIITLVNVVFKFYNLEKKHWKIDKKN